MEHADEPTSDLGGRLPSGVRRELGRGAVFGRYVVLDRLGTGGQGEVFAAWDGQLGRRVAIKLLLAGALPGSVEETRLIQEARALAQLSHPNVVAVYELGQAETAHYVAMELVEGVTLKEVLLSEKRESEIVRLLGAAGLGLAAIHRAGLVHRDVKPANILVGKDGRVCLTDFGLAVQVSANSNADTSSGDGLFVKDPSPGVAMGTLRYMAPELFAGAAATPLSDQFAFAVTAWLSLTGQPPFSDSVRHPVERMKHIELGPTGNLKSRRLRAILARGMASDPAQRYRSLELLLAALSGQRRQQLVRRVVTGVGLAAVPLALALGLWVGRAQPEGCTPQAQRQLRWPTSARGNLEARLKPSLGNDGAEEALRGFDGWFERWSVAASAACVEKRVDGCLVQAAEDATALVTLLSAPDSPDDVVREAPLALLALPPPAGCIGRNASLPTEERMPIVRLLSAVRASLAAGDPSRALVAARDATRLAAVADDEPLLAEARFEMARSLEAAGQSAEAVEPLEQAHAEAVRLALGDLQARVGVQQLHLLAGVLSRVDVAAALEPLVAAAVQREGRPGLKAQYLAARGELRNAQSRMREAERDLYAAIVEERRREPPDARRIARLVSMQSMVLVTDGRIEEAAALAVQNVEAMRRLVPKNHPELGRALNNQSVAQLSIDDFAGARVSIAEAAQVLAASLGPTHPFVAAPANNLGDLELRVGNLDEAQAAYQNAFGILSASMGVDARRTLVSKMGLARVQQARGDFVGARQAYDSVWARRLQLHGAGHVLVTEVQVAKAELELEAGQLAAARSLLVALAAVPAPPQEVPLLEGVAALLEGKTEVAAQWFNAAEQMLQKARPIRRQELAAARNLATPRPNTPLGRALGLLDKRLRRGR